MLNGNACSSCAACRSSESGIKLLQSALLLIFCMIVGFDLLLLLQLSCSYIEIKCLLLSGYLILQRLLRLLIQAGGSLRPTLGNLQRLISCRPRKDREVHMTIVVWVDFKESGKFLGRFCRLSLDSWLERQDSFGGFSASFDAVILFNLESLLILGELLNYFWDPFVGSCAAYFRYLVKFALDSSSEMVAI